MQLGKIATLCPVRASNDLVSLLARMTGSTATADDLSQETFIEVLRSIDRFRGDASLATWIRRVEFMDQLVRARYRENNADGFWHEVINDF